MLTKEQLKQIIVSQRENILKKSFGIERGVLEEIKAKRKLPHIIVITGVRRCGKSTLLKQIIEKYYKNKDFYYINFEDERLFNFDASNFNDIYETLFEIYGECKTFFIDEIQNINNFETFVRRFYDNGFKFYITGSNANLLSKELGTKLTGRHIDIVVKPFSFLEFLKLKKFKFEKNMIYLTETRVKIKKLFEEYLEKGGMPEYLQFNDTEILMRAYEDIILKDIIVRYNVDNVASIREMYQYMVSNFSNKFSYNAIKKIIEIGSVNTVKKYISYLEETFFAKTINKFEYSMKKQLINDKKLYIIDNGFLQILSTRLTSDKGWLLENMVFNALNIQYADIFYFSEKQECDFVTLKNKKISSIIQVTWELNETNKQRELTGLLSAMKFFKQKTGLILTYDQEDEKIMDGNKIIIKPVWKWLLEPMADE
jgi:predicted AAA+ superfamily ATPase